ncbi:MAG: hypothetical protein R3360_09700, partial [Alphaproteobacteria bacterium]|nr:hypothetical protein [Alphaproteobacteria bacterium]
SSDLVPVIARCKWFSTVGDVMSREERDIARDYLDQLGFPDAEIDAVEGWDQAAVCAANPGFDSEAFTVEESLRAHLSDRALEIVGEEQLIPILERIAKAAGSVVLDAAATAASLWAVEDETVVEAGAGAAIQSCHDAGLVLAAQAVEDHPFALKFRLFERGRWPIGVSGRSFHLF